MSTAHVSQVLDVHTRGAAAPKRHLRPHRTEISPIYQKSDTDNRTLKTNQSKLEPIEGDVLSLDLLNQYNEIVGPAESLAFKRLPSVKVSYQSTKHKFIESPSTEGTSRIIRPHLSMKTYSPGHHIFTEGISKSSIVRSPTFALQKVKVPYSNLPDSISIYKDKDKFAFGVKNDEYEKSPYRLTPKPFKLGSATFIPALEADSGKPHTKCEQVSKARRGSRSTLDSRQYFELKSNVIKLEPIVTKDDKSERYGTRRKSEFETDIVRVPMGFTRPTKSPLAPSNSFYVTELQPEEELETLPKEFKIEEELEDKLFKPDKLDRKLSVVSIGETVGPSFYDNKKREARQQYPMYDDTTRRNENYRRKKFEYGEDFTFKAKPQVPSSTFTYKVSMQGMSFLQDKPGDLFKPIRNNLRDRYGNPIHKQRGLGKYVSPNREEDASKVSSDYNFRRYYRRVFRRPKSSDSHSTEFSQLPGNPPPSEISHILSEDAPVLVNDIRNGMMTLMEERTITAASLISPRKENSPAEVNDESHNIKEVVVSEEPKATSRTQDSDTCTDTDIQFENALRNVERYNEQEIETSRTDITKSVGFDSSASATMEKPKELESARSVMGTSSKCESSVVEQYIAEAEERLKSISASEEKGPKTLKVDLVSEQNKITKLDPIEENLLNKNKAPVHQKLISNKTILPVPTFSLDSINQNPAMHISKERTSLSRSIQNMTVPDESTRRHVTKGVSNVTTTTEEKDAESGLRTTLPITRLRLFSGASTVSLKAPSVSVTDENGELHEVLDNDLNDSKATDQSIKEKKVVNNANVPFIYPSTSEVKAKRQ